jgi:hypothetical protein
MNGSPLRPRKETSDEIETFKKQKCRISKAAVKKITAQTVSQASCEWLERWLDQFVRENGFPPQLVSDDYYSLLTTYFPIATATQYVERIRTDYERAFPVIHDVPFEMDSLYDTMNRDNAVKAEYGFIFF